MNCFSFVRNLFFLLIVTLALSACGGDFRDVVAKRYADAWEKCFSGTLSACLDGAQLEQEIYSMSKDDQAAIMASARKYMERKKDESLFGQSDDFKNLSEATKENTDNEGVPEALLNNENQVSERIYKSPDVYKPIPTPTNDVVQNKEVEECLTSLNLNLSENRELINALAEKNDRVRMARDRWERGGESQYKIDIDNKTLSNMNENLKRICDNTKGETEIGFNFNS